MSKEKCKHCNGTGVDLPYNNHEAKDCKFCKGKGFITKKPVKNFIYLTDEEAKMPLEQSLLQLALGLQTCKTKGDAVDLLKDAVKLGELQERKRTVEQDAYVYMEFGYLQCEKGHNIQMARLNFTKTLKGDKKK
jgi:hypothetical protein